MSELHAISPIGPRRVDEDDANIAARRRPAGPLFQVLKTWCCKESPLGPNARHVLVQIARRMQADAEGREVAFMGEERLAQDTGLSQRTVRRAVKDLRVAGVIKTSQGGVTRGHHHLCNEYELIGRFSAEGGGQRDRRGRSRCPDREVTVASIRLP